MIIEAASPCLDNADNRHMLIKLVTDGAKVSIFSHLHKAVMLISNALLICLLLLVLTRMRSNSSSWVSFTTCNQFSPQSTIKLIDTVSKLQFMFHKQGLKLYQVNISPPMLWLSCLEKQQVCYWKYCQNNNHIVQTLTTKGVDKFQNVHNYPHTIANNCSTNQLIHTQKDCNLHDLHIKKTTYLLVHSELEIGENLDSLFSLQPWNIFCVCYWLCSFGVT